MTPRILMSTAAAVLLWSGIDPAHAETASNADASSLQEVVVTATRRTERLQDVPISVAVFSQEALDAQGVRGIDDLTRLTPGVTFQRNAVGSSGNYNDEQSDINIRGVDSTAGTATVGIYIDDTPIQTRRIGFGTFNAFPALFDLDRVEVLRGPQGTLFGASSEGGSVRFLSTAPGLQDYSGYVRSELATTAHGDPSYEAGAAAGGPLVPGVLGFRASASFRRDGGYVDRVDYSTLRVVEPRSNWQETATVRLAFTWKPLEHLSVTPSFYYQELYLNDTSAYWENLSSPASNGFRNGNAGRDTSRDPFYLAAVRLNWDLGPAELIASTSYYSRRQHANVDYTQFLRTIYLGNPLPAPGDLATTYVTDHQDNFYQELRLASKDAEARLSWNAGIYFAQLKENNIQFEHDPTLDQEYLAANGVPFCTPQVPCPGGIIYAQPYNRVSDHQAALFAEAGWRLTRMLRLTMGARVSHDEFRGQSLSAGPDGAGVPIRQDHSGTENPVTPQVVLGFQPDRDSLFYLSASKGFRVGGTNIDLGVVDSCVPDLISLGIRPGADGRLHSQTTYRSDSLWSYELGSKNTLLQRRLQINFSLFMIDWRDIQQTVYLPNCGDSFTTNLGRVRSRGGDLQVLYRPVEALTVDLSLSRMDAKYTHTVCLPGLEYGAGGCLAPGVSSPLGGPIVSDRDRLVGPPWTVVTSVEGLLPRVGPGVPYLRADFQYSSAQRAVLPGQNPNNGVSDPTIPGLPVVSNLGLRIGYRWSGADLSAFVQNATNSHPLLFASRDSTYNDLLYFGRTQRPRTIGLTGTLRF